MKDGRYVLISILFCLLLAGGIMFFSIKNFKNIKSSEGKEGSINSYEGDDKVLGKPKLGKVDGDVNVNVLRHKTGRVETVELEEYIKGVVSGEMPVEFPLEALKSQAVAARTYAVARLELFGGKGYDKNIKADLIDTVANQVYHSKEERMEMWPEEKKNKYWEKIEQAVNETKGQVLTYKEQLVESPLYFSTSWGETEDSEQVFQSATPYLRSVDSKVDASSPKYLNSNIIDNSAIINKVNSYYPGALNYNSSLSSQISITKKDDNGAVRKIRIGDKEITGVEFRKCTKINSVHFNLKFMDDKVEVETMGYGHNVGMSQFGAKGMAAEGSDYSKILKHYYTDVELFNIYK